MDWKTTDHETYQPRSLWKSDQIPDLPCIRNAAPQSDYASSAPESDCTETLHAVLRALAPFADARKAVLEAMGPPDPPRAP